MNAMTFDPPLAIESGADSIGTGLHVRGVRLTIDGGQTLLDGVSFSARPGTLTAVIGPSGAGKSTLAKVIVGATQPSQGAVSFDGHDIHGAYGALCSRIEWCRKKTWCIGS
jgi:ABC-type multidrug transport system ATPase subunit